MISDDKLHSVESLLALYTTIQNDIAYYRAWKWNITGLYALFSTGIISIITNSTIKPYIGEGIRCTLILIQSYALIYSLIHLYKMHYYLTKNRQIRHKIEKQLGFFKNDIYLLHNSILPKEYDKERNFFSIELTSFILPFVIFLVLYQLFTIYLIFNLGK